MAKMHACSQIEDKLMPYLHNKLSDKQRSSFEEHLKSCNKCNIEASFYQKMKALKQKEISAIPPQTYVNIAKNVMASIKQKDTK